MSCKIAAEFRIVTPMFMGGFDQKPETVRGSSIKGALRFWWRALQWDSILLSNAGNETEALKQLHREEADLFGTASDDGGGKQSQAKFLLRVFDSQVVRKSDDQSGITYLLGQGLANAHGKVKRDYLEGQFQVQIALKKSTSDEQISTLINTLKIFGLLGGLGSRVRRGLGSIAIKSMKIFGDGFPLDWHAPRTADAYIDEIRHLVGVPKNTRPSFSSFSSESRLIAISRNKSAMESIKWINEEFQMYRTYGISSENGEGRVLNGKTVVPRFPDDHDMVLAVARRPQDATILPRRAVFGLPHNYRYRDRTEVNINATGPGRKRRASPLLIHVHYLETNQTVVTLLALPALFLPPGDKVAMGRAQVPSTVDFSELDLFMNRYAGMGKEVLNGRA